MYIFSIQKCKFDTNWFSIFKFLDVFISQSVYFSTNNSAKNIPYFFKDIPAYLTHLCPIFGLVSKTFFSSRMVFSLVSSLLWYLFAYHIWHFWFHTDTSEFIRPFEYFSFKENWNMNWCLINYLTEKVYFQKKKYINIWIGLSVSRGKYLTL